MALNQTLAQMRTNVRRFTDSGGTNALVRHPDADLNDYINRALGSLHRILTQNLPDQRVLSSTTVATSSGTATYALPADFDHLISVDLTANGVKVWLVGYEMHERPMLTDSGTSYAGIPHTYRLRGSNIELLPTPQGTYTGTLWYTPTPSQLSLDADTYDTINRVDDYVIAYASRFVATKDKNWDLLNECKSLIAEMRSDLEALAVKRDKNSPPRIVDEGHADRFGRRLGRRRYG